MAKKRVHEIAKEQGVSSKDLIAKLQAAGIEVKAAASSVEEGDALKVLGGNGAGSKADASAAQATATKAPPAESPPQPAAESSPQAPAQGDGQGQPAAPAGDGQAQ